MALHCRQMRWLHTQRLKTLWRRPRGAALPPTSSCTQRASLLRLLPLLLLWVLVLVLVLLVLLLVLAGLVVLGLEPLLELAPGPEEEEDEERERERGGWPLL